MSKLNIFDRELRSGLGMSSYQKNIFLEFTHLYASSLCEEIIVIRHNLGNSNTYQSFISLWISMINKAYISKITFKLFSVSYIVSLSVSKNEILYCLPCLFLFRTSNLFNSS